MPRGGYRPNSGRKPAPLAEKIASGNPNKQPLKKVVFENRDGKPVKTCRKPPPYLVMMERKENGLPTPIELYHSVVEYLEPSECLNLIPTEILSDYVMAKYYLLCSQYELSYAPTVLTLKCEKGKAKDFKVSDFTKAMLQLQKNVVLCWQPIWEIVSKNSQKMIVNEGDALMSHFITARCRFGKVDGGELLV